MDKKPGYMVTPGKIQRLMHLAEDKSFDEPRRFLYKDADNKLFRSVMENKSERNTQYEESSGVLDIEKLEGFGECSFANASLSKSTAFNPGELTGRSTGTEDAHTPPTTPASLHHVSNHGCNSLNIDSLQGHLERQTLEINNIMRQSIASDYTFHSKRDLTADEESLIMREAPLPIPHGTQLNFQDSFNLNQTNMSVGTYFKNRCPDFARILSKTDSPVRSIPSNSMNVSLEPIGVSNQTYKVDNTLDSIPVKQPKIPNHDNIPERLTMNVTNVIQNPYKHTDTPIPTFSNMDSHKTDYVKGGLNMSSNNLLSGSGQTENRNPKGYCNKSFMMPPKTTDILRRKLQSSMKLVTEETEGSIEKSISISKIQDYLGRQSNISVTEMLKLNNNSELPSRKHPLTEININLLEDKIHNQDVVVTHLKDTRKAETASSSGTLKTIISAPATIHGQERNSDYDIVSMEKTQSERTNVRSKSPPNKSQCSLSTVQDIISFKSGGSPAHSGKGETHMTHIPSPNIGYRELDKSVDWLEVLRQKEECLAKEHWANIVSPKVDGFVGVSCAATIFISSVTDSWLTARFEFEKLPVTGKSLTIELPRQPLLLSPGKEEKFTIHLISNVEMTTELPFTMYLKDASLDIEITQQGFLEVNFKMPTIQAISCEGVNVVSFPTVREKSTVTKFFVLISDCPVDLKLELAITEGGSVFVIKNVQEIRRNDVNKALMETDDQQPSKPKGKGNKQLCRLTGDSAIKVSVTFNSPTLEAMGIAETTAMFKGTITVNVIGSNTVLKKISVVAIVGTSHLVIQPSENKLHLTNEPTTIILSNTGAVAGSWVVKFQSSAFNENNFPFRVSPDKFEIPPGGCAKLNMVYTGPNDVLNEATLKLEDVSTEKTASIEINGGVNKPKIFPIKTNMAVMTWVRAGRKELSLKNFSDKKVQIRCQVSGEGFSIDLPGHESRGVYCLTFGPCECRPLPVVYRPAAPGPHAAMLHLFLDKNSEACGKVKLHGCSGGAPLRWLGQVTYGETALVRALYRADVDLALFNKDTAPAFVAATVHFNLQYTCMSSHVRVLGSRRVVGGRSRHALALRLDWARLERRARLVRASTLATVTVLTGPEYTRLRILRILKKESKTDELQTALLPDHLKVLTEQFEGEDSNMHKYLEDFNETKAALPELIESLQELTAQVDLPQDFADDNTIFLSDDTELEHYTLCD